MAQARGLSVALLLAALLAAAVLALIARRSSPASEGAAIRRRYAPLLASVQPITTPPDLPLIEVTEFATLAKLAERCGLLVLHWSRSGETVTFRSVGASGRKSPGRPDYAFDAWMAREYPGIQFERYAADDAVVHCVTEAQAKRLVVAIGNRMAEVGLRLHPTKIMVVYC